MSLMRFGKKEIFYMAYTFYVLRDPFLTRTAISDLFGNVIVNQLSLLFKIAVLLLCSCYLIVFNRYTLKSLILIFGSIAVFSMSAYMNHVSSMLLSLLLIFCGKNIDFEELVKHHIKITLIMSCLISLLAYTGLIRNISRLRDSIGVIRNSYGFGHYNTFALLMFQWIAEYLYLNRNTHTVRKYIFPFFITALSFFITCSFTAAAVSIFLISACIVIDFMEKKEKLSFNILKTLTLGGIALLIFIFYYFWNHPYEITRYFSTFRDRFLLAQKYLYAYGVNLWGHRIVMGSSVTLPGYIWSGYAYLDNGYTRILVESGLVVFLSFLTIYSSCLWKSIKKRETTLCAIHICYLIYGFMEYTAFLLSFNTFLLLFTVDVSKYVKASNLQEQTLERSKHRHGQYQSEQFDQTDPDIATGNAGGVPPHL